MEFLNDYLTWFQQNEETLKNMSPAKAKGKIIYELLLRGLASPAIQNVSLAVGPDGKITDASLKFMQSKMQQNIVSSEVVFAMLEKKKKEAQAQTVSKLDDLIHGFREEDKCHIHGLDDNKPKFTITFDEEYHKNVQRLSKNNGNVKRYIADYMGEQIRTQQAERKAAKAALEAYYQTHEDQRPAQTTTDAKQSVAPEAKSMPAHGYETESQETQESAPAEFTVDDIIYAYLDTGELTPEQEAFLQTQEINGLEDLKAMIPPGMLPPEMEMSGPDNEEI